MLIYLHNSLPTRLYTRMWFIIQFWEEKGDYFYMSSRGVVLMKGPLEFN